MPNCKEYSEMTIIEKIQLLGKLIHLFQNNSDFHREVCTKLVVAETDGEFDNVTILPQQNNSNDFQG